MSSNDNKNRKRRYRRKNTRTSKNITKKTKILSSSSSSEDDEEYITNILIKDRQTEDGYINDGFVVSNNYESLDPELILIRQEKSLNTSQKKELKTIKEIMVSEKPSLNKIMSSNLVLDDKKKCLYLLHQYLNTDPCSTEYLSLLTEINDIIGKGDKFTSKEVKYLEDKEKRIRSISNPDIDLKQEILNMDADDKVISIVYLQYLEMLKHEISSTTYASLREEIEWSTRLPHQRTIGTSLFSKLIKAEPETVNKYYVEIKDKLDQELYGMENVKHRLLQMLNDRRTSGFAGGRNIGLKGPPGVGKTAIGKSLAKVLGLPFEKISVGGLEDATVLKGSDRVWNSAAPSIILQILARSKYSDIIIMLDEVDKLGYTAKGKEVQYALLHISDYSHNYEFRDNYLNKYPHDLSRIWFIFNMNDDSMLDPAFRDRMDIIEVSDYDLDEKKIILDQYMLPRTLIHLGLSIGDIIFTDSGLKYLIEYIYKEEKVGLRKGEKAIKSIIGKVNMYLSVLLQDDTTGDLVLPYKLPKSCRKFPIKLNSKIIKELLIN